MTHSGRPSPSASGSVARLPPKPGCCSGPTIRASSESARFHDRPCRAADHQDAPAAAEWVRGREPDEQLTATVAVHVAGRREGRRRFVEPSPADPRGPPGVEAAHFGCRCRRAAGRDRSCVPAGAPPRTITARSRGRATTRSAWPSPSKSPAEAKLSPRLSPAEAPSMRTTRGSLRTSTAPGSRRPRTMYTEPAFGRPFGPAPIAPKATSPRPSPSQSPTRSLRPRPTGPGGRSNSAGSSRCVTTRPLNPGRDGSRVQDRRRSRPISLSEAGLARADVVLQADGDILDAVAVDVARRGEHGRYRCRRCRSGARRAGRCPPPPGGRAARKVHNR